ncbi:MAG: hypothetical protein LBG83_09105 [Oscillospiraceae bacterium]|jgi:hypothetical protein|nr:hypothetical protein [Oscillospiraceae bacterium]
MKKIFALLLASLMLLALAIPGFALKTSAELRQKFPDGKYWNHVGMNQNNPDGWTNKPCPDHSKFETCNQYNKDHSQCLGYAEKLAFDAYDCNVYTWKLNWNLNELKPGDVIRRYAHSIFITAVDGDKVTYTDCNSDNTCVIKWGETITKKELKRGLVYVQHAPWALDGTPKSVSSSEKAFWPLSISFHWAFGNILRLMSVFYVMRAMYSPNPVLW